MAASSPYRVAPQQVSRCRVRRCRKPSRSRGYCQMHYARWQRNGSPRLQPRKLPPPPPGENNPNWSGDLVGYRGAHHRVNRQRGRATDHQCADCLAPAMQWSYDHNDPDEKTDRNGTYSADPNHYEPRCIPCHNRFDQLIGV